MTIEKLLSPIGRIVFGNPARPQIKKDQRTGQPVLRDGKQVEQWVFGLAIPKADFNAHIWPAFQQEAATVFPQGVPPQFSWKIKDGDGVDRKGRPYNQREGYAGCFILTISTEAFAPQIFKFENGAYRQLAAEEIKTGDFARVNINAKANAPTNPQHTPGLYVNPNGIEWVAYGQEIISTGGDPDEMFGGQAVTALPPGASAVPFSNAPANAPMPGQQPMPQYTPQPQQPMPQYGPQPGYQQPPMATGYAQPVYAQPQQPMPQPAHDFVHNAGVVMQPGFTQPVQNVGVQPQYAPQVVTGIVPGVTSSPSNPGYGPQPGYAPQPQYGPQPMPGQPQPR